MKPVTKPLKRKIGSEVILELDSTESINGLLSHGHTVKSMVYVAGSEMPYKVVFEVNKGSSAALLKLLSLYNSVPDKNKTVISRRNFDMGKKTCTLRMNKDEREEFYSLDPALGIKTAVDYFSYKLGRKK